MAKIGITSQTFRRREDLRALALKGLAGHEILFAPLSADAPGSHAEMSPAEIRNFLFSCDGALVGRESVDDALLAAAPSLKMISLYGVGHDNIDLAACSRRGIPVFVAHGVNAQAVAEHTLGLIISVLHNIALTDRLLRAGTWDKDGGRTLAGKTVAVVGVGAVGSRVARLCRAFGCEVLLTDIVSKAKLAKEIEALEATLAESREKADVLTVHVPLTGLTKGMFDARTIGLMKPGSVLINTSRGAVVSLEALREALSKGHLAGAGLDVFENEPIVGGRGPISGPGGHRDEGLFALPTLVATPHIAGNSVETVLAMGSAAVAALAAYFT